VGREDWTCRLGPGGNFRKQDIHISCTAPFESSQTEHVGKVVVYACFWETAKPSLVSYSLRDGKVHRLGIGTDITYGILSTFGK
jgi:hypothetical protein